MKFKVHIIFSLLLTLGSVNAFAQIGIGTKTPAASAALEVSSSTNNKGILIPRITATQKDAIVSPAEGLLVYQTTAPIGFYYYSNTVWKLIVDQTDLDNKLASAKTYVDDKIAAATIADANVTTKGKIQLAGDLGGTAAAPTVPGLALKANSADLATVATSGNYNDLVNKPSAYVIPKASTSELGGVKIGANLSIDANGVLSAAASNSITGVVPVANGGTGATTVAAALTSLGAAPIASPTFTGAVTAPIYASTPQALTDGSTINWDPALGLNASVTLGGNRTLSFSTTPVAGAYGTLVITQDATGSRTLTLPTINGVTNKVLGSISTSAVELSTAGNSRDILNFYFDGTTCYWNIGQGYGTAATAASSTTNLSSGFTGSLPVANGGTGATTAAAALTSLGAAPIASPTFTGAVTAPIYASTPQALTDASTIIWDPALGLNASVTLGGNRTLSFLTTPVAGAYGTLVITQDGTGSRTITLPSTTNKVLGSTSTTSIALSTAANTKDILNFYYDGTNCYWNIGQGYGSASSSSSTVNLASGVTGTLPVANGGTGATTLTGLVKGSGTSALTAAIAGTDYQAPLTLTTTGTGAATLSGTTLNIPTASSGGGSIHTIGEAYGGGIVFYVYDGGKHGLIGATVDQSVQTPWSSSGGWTRAQADGVGAGLKNTTLIIGNSITLNATTSNAATVCNEYSVTETVGGITTKYGDWYLPSRYELQLLYAQKSLFSGLTNGFYWSSNEWESIHNESNVAWTVLFNDGQAHGYNKGHTDSGVSGGGVMRGPIRARAIRAF